MRGPAGRWGCLWRRGAGLGDPHISEALLGTCIQVSKTHVSRRSLLPAVLPGLPFLEARRSVRKSVGPSRQSGQKFGGGGGMPHALDPEVILEQSGMMGWDQGRTRRPSGLSKLPQEQNRDKGAAFSHSLGVVARVSAQFCPSSHAPLTCFQCYKCVLSRHCSFLLAKQEASDRLTAQFPRCMLGEHR